MRKLWHWLKGVFSKAGPTAPTPKTFSGDEFRSVPIPVSREQVKAKRRQQKLFARGWFAQEHHQPTLTGARLERTRESCHRRHLIVLSRGDRRAYGL